MNLDVNSELPEGDIGHLLRMGWPRPRDRRVVRQRPVGLAARVGPKRIARRPPTGPRALRRLAGRLPTISMIPKAERRFDTDRFGMRAVDDFSSGLRRLESDPDSIVVAVHGVCRPGRGGPKAGYGVFVSGFADDLNRSGLVPYLSPQTREYAELFATMRALDVIHDLIIAGEDLTHVIIKSNSEYLVNGVSVLIWKWVGNGFTNCEGRPMVNGRAFKYLHEKVVLLENEYGTRVSFCQVDKEFNEQADALAHEAVRNS